MVQKSYLWSETGAGTAGLLLSAFWRSRRVRVYDGIGFVQCKALRKPSAFNLIPVERGLTLSASLPGQAALSSSLDSRGEPGDHSPRCF